MTYFLRSKFLLCNWEIKRLKLDNSTILVKEMWRGQCFEVALFSWVYYLTQKMLREMIESQHTDSSPLRQMSVMLGWLKRIARSVSHMIFCSKLPTVFFKIRQKKIYLNKSPAGILWNYSVNIMYWKFHLFRFIII